MNSGHKKTVGALGEGAVANHLQRNGFAIVTRNYRKKWGEIDLITIKDGIVHFIEVKTVSREIINSKSGMVPHGTSYRPEDNVHPSKLKRLHRAIQSWLIEEDFEGEWQVDVAAVFLDVHNKKASVRLIENVILE